MTAISDIDLASLAKKFMPDDRTNDGIVNTIAQTFLLNPQVALNFVLRAKNKLQVLITKEIDFLNKMLGSLDYINRADFEITDTSYLTSAQSALVELDRTGNVTNQSFFNYQNSINSFLNTSLFKVKSGSSNQFASSSSESKEDLFIGLAGFSLYHPQIIDLINSIVSSLDDFRSIDLAKRVSRSIISNVRTSVADTITTLNDNSKIGTTVELLAGSAMIQSIIGKIDILDPIIKTGVQPFNTNIKAFSDPTPAIAISSISPLTTTHTDFSLKVDGGITQTHEYPASGVNKHAFIVSSISSDSYVIPMDGKLYLKVLTQAPLNPPATVAGGSPPATIWITMTPGTRTFSNIQADIEAGLEAFDDHGALTRYGHCTEFSVNGSKCLLIYGVDNVTGFQIVENIPGFITPPYSPPDPSVHSILGFATSQVSDAIGTVNVNTLSRFCSLAFTGATFSVKDKALVVQSNNTNPDSSLQFFTGVATDIGLQTEYAPSPQFISLDDGGFIDSSSLDIHPGFRFVQDTQSYIISDISDGTIRVQGTILPFLLSDISIFSDVENIITSLLKDLSSQNTFSNDLKNIQLLISPLISSNATNAQVGDFRRFINDVVNRLTIVLSILQNYPLQTSLSNSEQIAKEILYTLETHNLNNLIDLLTSCKFNQFFSIDTNSTSSGLNLISSIESTGQSIVGGQ